MHYGPVVERSGDVFGATVNIAARLTAHAHVGQLVASDAIACLVVGRPDLQTTALGSTWLKNVGEPVEIYTITEHGVAATSQVLDPVCRMFVDADAAPAHLPWDGRAWHFCSFDCARTFTQDPAKYADPNRSTERP